MLIYLDLLFILNLWIDFLLLITTNTILKYDIKIKNVFCSSFFGAFSTFMVLIHNDIILITLKVVVSVIMQLIMNGYKGIKTLLENTLYFYLVSIILAGFLFIFNIDNIGLKQRYMILITITPIVLFICKKKIKKLNTYYKEIYKVTIVIKNKKYNFNALLDTGNMLYDPYKKRPISIIYNKKIKYDYNNGILVPIETANKKSILKCIKVDKLIIEDKVINNALIGLSQNKFNIQDINMILHKDMIGGMK